MAVKLLRRSVLVLAGYFLAVSLAHLFQFKAPLLFIYYDVPSTLYQDSIISFMAFGWAVLLLGAAEGLGRGLLWPMRYVLVAGAGALAGLAMINATTDFAAIKPGLSPGPYWAQSWLLAAYLIWLGILYVKADRD